MSIFHCSFRFQRQVLKQLPRNDADIFGNFIDGTMQHLYWQWDPILQLREIDMQDGAFRNFIRAFKLLENRGSFFPMGT
jgi:hypothetical protein